jgi:hypothetical protein
LISDDAGNTKDPVLMPWAATQIQATNDDILHGVRDIPCCCKKAFPNSSCDARPHDFG